MALSYGDPVIHHTYTNYKSYRKRPSERYQKMNYTGNAHTTPLFKNLQILKLKDIYILQLSKLMHSYIYCILPTPLLNLFTVNRNIHLHKTRQQNQPHIIHRRTAFTSKTFIHQAPDKWYKLPENIRQLRSVNNFNRNVKNT